MGLRSTSTGDLMNEVNALTRELTQERALVRSWIEKAEATRAATEALLVLNQDLRAETEKWKDLVKTFSAGNVALEAENERLQRENGALARTYALAEKLLRERTEALNEALAQNERFDKRYRDAEDDVERLRALVEKQEHVIRAVRSLRERGGDKPSRGVWPALHEVFDALDAYDER